MQQKAPRRTRERILELSLRLFNEFGEPNITTTVIAEEMNISPGNLYYHYPAKDELINALFNRRGEACTTDTEAASANLTNSVSGLKAWRVEDIVGYLKTGHGERAGSFGPMNEVIVNSTSQMSDADLRAMAVYLKSLAAVDIGGAVELSGRARGAP